MLHNNYDKNKLQNQLPIIKKKINLPTYFNYRLMFYEMSIFNY